MLTWENDHEYLGSDLHMSYTESTHDQIRFCRLARGISTFARFVPETVVRTAQKMERKGMAQFFAVGTSRFLCCHGATPWVIVI